MSAIQWAILALCIGLVVVIALAALIERTPVDRYEDRDWSEFEALSIAANTRPAPIMDDTLAPVRPHVRAGGCQPAPTSRPVVRPPAKP